MLKIARRADAEAAPPIPDRLPWGSREDLQLAQDEPPRPLPVSADLSEDDVEQLRRLAAGRKLSFPWVLAVLIYFGLKYSLGDEVPDFALYGLLGAVFVINTLLAMRKDNNHYASPGRLTMTLSADGVEVSAERWAGHVPWVLVDTFARTNEAIVVHTASTPRFHALPIGALDPETLDAVDGWVRFAARHRRRRPGRTLLGLAALIALGLAAFTAWQRFGHFFVPGE